MIYNKQETQKLTEKDTGITFRLTREFLENYKDEPVPFGFNGVGFLAYMRTYSRIKEDGTKEQWYETCARVINGVYSIQKRHILKYHLGWDEDKAQRSAQEMYDRMFKMKWLPPGRGIWAMGSPIIEEKGLFASLNNCAFVSTKNIDKDPARPFAFLMDMSMLGVGVGFDTKGASTITILSPNSHREEEFDPSVAQLKIKSQERAGVETNLSFIPTIQKYMKEEEDTLIDSAEMVEWNEKTEKWQLTDEMNDLIMNKINWHKTGELKEGYIYQIPDTREGWVESTVALINAYLKGDPFPIMRYDRIRPRGTEISTFGGTASGPDPLIHLHQQIIKQFEGRAGEEITSRDIVDLMNKIGVCVVSGNVRRSAEIAFGDPEDKDYLKLKDYNWNQKEMQYEGSEKDRAPWGWSSNNSIFAELGMDYTEHGTQTAKNGEPGYIWMENARKHGRMNGLESEFADIRAEGANPCVEQTLESYELCCLVETFPTKSEGIEDYKRTLKFAYLYAKTVTLGNTHWVETNRVMMRNRRIGASMSGIAQFIDTNGIHKLKDFCTKGYDTVRYYDEVYSDWLAVPKSIKVTSVKPSGTVSLLPGVTPGVHFPEDNYYIRRITLSKDSPLVEVCKEAGYEVKDAVDDNSAVKVEIPVAISNVRTVNEVSMWEQLEIAAFMQEYWADNQVSCTVTFQPHEANQIPHALNYFQYKLKGISFLPKLKEGTYAQAPYEGITRRKYLELDKGVRVLEFKGKAEDSIPEKYCDNDVCEI